MPVAGAEGALLGADVAGVFVVVGAEGALLAGVLAVSAAGLGDFFRVVVGRDSAVVVFVSVGLVLLVTVLLGGGLGGWPGGSVVETPVDGISSLPWICSGALETGDD